MMPKKIWTDEILASLKALYFESLDDKEIAERLREEFPNLDITPEKVAMQRSRHGYTTKPGGKKVTLDLPDFMKK